MMRVAVSTFPFLYSHSGRDALLHLADQDYTAFEMMIFPPHCWPAELSAGTRREIITDATRPGSDADGDIHVSYDILARHGREARPAPR